MSLQTGVAKHRLAAMAWLLATVSGAARGDEAGAARCDPETGCPARISLTSFAGREAYRLTDGRSEALVVPSLGRIVLFGLVGGPNLLGSGGGERLNILSHHQLLFAGDRYDAEVVTGGNLRLTSRATAGLRVQRELGFDSRGDLVISQAVRNLAAAPRQLALRWLTPVAPGAEVFAGSAALAAVSGGVAFSQHLQAAASPSSSSLLATTRSTAVRGPCEASLAAANQIFAAGSRRQYTVRWSLQQLPSGSLANPALRAAIDMLLGTG